MTFPAAGGHANLPQGNWSPEIFSKKALMAYRRESVIDAITNSNYYGEISNYGDTVRIIREPDITVNDYTRGQDITPQPLDDDELTLTIDQAKWFAFEVEDVESALSHMNWEDLATDRAGYKMKNAVDSNDLTYISTQVTTANTLGTTASPQQIGFSGLSSVMTPLQVMNRLKRTLALADIPEEKRWFVADPVFYEMLGFGIVIGTN